MVFCNFGLFWLIFEITLWIQSTSGKMMISYVFQIHGIWAFWHFSSESSHQKYSVWVPGNLTKSCFAVWCFFLKKNATFLNQSVYLSVFRVKQYTSFIYVIRMSFYLVNWSFLFVGSWGPISCRKVAQMFHGFEG